jgi:cob(I)alamin adenosyltransferase
LSEWIKVEQYASDAHVLEKRQPSDVEMAAAKRGLARVSEEYARRGFDIIILDEICVAVHFGLIQEMDVIPLLEHKPESVELVLTGRYCPASWLEHADLITEMKEVKHYFKKGVLSRKGFDS